MTRHVFLEELEELNNDVIRMGSVLEQSLNEMILALERIDVEKAEIIMDRDDEIDAYEQNIERKCIQLIAKQQPIATDLRKITSIMKIVTDIERIADHCSDISEYIISLHHYPKISKPVHLTNMVQAMKTMVIDTIDSFVKEDVHKAQNVMASDDIVDGYFAQISEEIIEIMKQEKDTIHQGAAYLMIIKYLERMADHATNIAEWIVFIVTGELVATE